MKKMLYTAVLALSLTGSAFANEKAGINPRNVKTSNQVVSIRLSNESSKKLSNLAVEMQYYDFVCSSGATAHAAFSNANEAFTWGLKWCSEQNNKSKYR
jgi:predicted transcriptional regulator